MSKENHGLGSKSASPKKKHDSSRFSYSEQTWGGERPKTSAGDNRRVNQISSMVATGNSSSRFQGEIKSNRDDQRRFSPRGEPRVTSFLRRSTETNALGDGRDLEALSDNLSEYGGHLVADDNTPLASIEGEERSINTFATPDSLRADEESHTAEKGYDFFSASKGNITRVTGSRQTGKTPQRPVRNKSSGTVSPRYNTIQATLGGIGGRSYLSTITPRITPRPPENPKSQNQQRPRAGRTPIQETPPNRRLNDALKHNDLQFSSGKKTPMTRQSASKKDTTNSSTKVVKASFEAKARRYMRGEFSPEIHDSHKQDKYHVSHVHYLNTKQNKAEDSLEDCRSGIVSSIFSNEYLDQIIYRVPSDKIRIIYYDTAREGYYDYDHGNKIALEEGTIRTIKSQAKDILSGQKNIPEEQEGDIYKKIMLNLVEQHYIENKEIYFDQSSAKYYDRDSNTEILLEEDEIDKIDSSATNYVNEGIDDGSITIGVNDDQAYQQKVFELVREVYINNKTQNKTMFSELFRAQIHEELEVINTKLPKTKSFTDAIIQQRKESQLLFIRVIKEGLKASYPGVTIDFKPVWNIREEDIPANKKRGDKGYQRYCDSLDQTPIFRSIQNEKVKDFLINNPPRGEIINTRTIQQVPTMIPRFRWDKQSSYYLPRELDILRMMFDEKFNGNYSGTEDNIKDSLEVLYPVYENCAKVFRNIHQSDNKTKLQNLIKILDNKYIENEIANNPENRHRENPLLSRRRIHQVNDYTIENYDNQFSNIELRGYSTLNSKVVQNLSKEYASRMGLDYMLSKNGDDYNIAFYDKSRLLDSLGFFSENYRIFEEFNDKFEKLAQISEGEITSNFLKSLNSLQQGLRRISDSTDNQPYIDSISEEKKDIEALVSQLDSENSSLSSNLKISVSEIREQIKEYKQSIKDIQEGITNGFLEGSSLNNVISENKIIKQDLIEKLESLECEIAEQKAGNAGLNKLKSLEEEKNSARKKKYLEECEKYKRYKLNIKNTLKNDFGFSDTEVDQFIKDNEPLRKLFEEGEKHISSAKSDFYTFEYLAIANEAIAKQIKSELGNLKEKLLKKELGRNVGLAEQLASLRADKIVEDNQEYSHALSDMESQRTDLLEESKNHPKALKEQNDKLAKDVAKANLEITKLKRAKIEEDFKAIKKEKGEKIIRILNEIKSIQPNSVLSSQKENTVRDVEDNFQFLDEEAKKIIIELEGQSRQEDISADLLNDEISKNIVKRQTNQFVRLPGTLSGSIDRSKGCFFYSDLCEDYSKMMDELLNERLELYQNIGNQEKKINEGLLKEVAKLCGDESANHDGELSVASTKYPGNRSFNSKRTALRDLSGEGFDDKDLKGRSELNNQLKKEIIGAKLLLEKTKLDELKNQFNQIRSKKNHELETLLSTIRNIDSEYKLPSEESVKIELVEGNFEVLSEKAGEIITDLEEDANNPEVTADNLEGKKAANIVKRDTNPFMNLSQEISKDSLKPQDGCFLEEDVCTRYQKLYDDFLSKVKKHNDKCVEEKSNRDYAGVWQEYRRLGMEYCTEFLEIQEIDLKSAVEEKKRLEESIEETDEKMQVHKDMQRLNILTENDKQECASILNTLARNREKLLNSFKGCEDFIDNNTATEEEKDQVQKVKEYFTQNELFIKGMKDLFERDIKPTLNGWEINVEEEKSPSPAPSPRSGGVSSITDEGRY